MTKNYTDIDQLLDETVEMAEEFSILTLSRIEIDKLLEHTQDW